MTTLICKNRVLRGIVLAAFVLLAAAFLTVPSRADTNTTRALQLDTVTAAAREQTQPAAVTLKRVYSDKKGEITVKWDKVYGADQYQIAYRVKGSSKWKIKTVNASSLKTTLKNKKIAKKYAVKVRAIVTTNGKKRYGTWSVKKYARVCNGKIVYLTFDDGPAANMGKVLEVLDKYNVKATFFVTGSEPEYRYLITAASEQGHAIGLHSYTHEYSLIYKSQSAFFSDLKRIQAVVKEYTGSKTKLLRFPGGSSNTVSRHYKSGIMTSLTKTVEKRGYVYFDWNVDSCDASGSNIAVSTIVKNATSVSSSVQYVNILMHCSSSKNTTVTALPKIIKYYRKRGYSFAALSEDSYTAHHPVSN